MKIFHPEIFAIKNREPPKISGACAPIRTDPFVFALCGLGFFSAGVHEEIALHQSVMKLKFTTVWGTKVHLCTPFFINLEVFLDFRERMLNEGQEAYGVLSPLGVACLSWD